MKSNPFLKRIRSVENMTKSEARLAEFFEQNYPIGCLGTLTSISVEVNVGKATVNRFISRLGFNGFTDFQNHIREEIVKYVDGPIDRYSINKSKRDGDRVDYLLESTNLAQKNIIETHARMDPNDFEAAVRLMAKPSGGLYIVGQGASHAIGHMFWYQAKFIRNNVHFIDNIHASLGHQLIDIFKNDTLFVIANQRYSRLSMQVSKWFHLRGAQIVLLTDRSATPLSEFATVQLVARNEGLSLYFCDCARLVVIQALLAAMTSQLEKDLLDRSESAESLYTHFDLTLQNTLQKNHY